MARFPNKRDHNIRRDNLCKYHYLKNDYPNVYGSNISISIYMMHGYNVSLKDFTKDNNYFSYTNSQEKSVIEENWFFL